MRLEDMKKNIPETPEFIHKMIESEVKKQLQDTKLVTMQNRKVKKWTGARVAAILVVCVLATSTVAYAGVKLYHVYLEQQGTYSVATGIESDDSSGEMTIPEKIHDVEVTAEYIPEGMEWMDEFRLQYPEMERKGGFSFDVVLLDNNDLDIVMQDENVVDSEKRFFGSYEGVYLQYNDFLKDGSFNQRIYLFCPEVYRAITIYIGDDITKEEAVKVVENLVITEKDSMIETAGMYTWSEVVSPKEYFAEAEITSIEDHKLPVHQIGDTFELSVSGEDNSGNSIEEKIEVCVDSVQVADDLQLLGENALPEGWAEAIGADGKLVNNTRFYIKSGDGIESIDEIINTEDVKQKLVFATVTYTNHLDQEIAHMSYLGAVMLMNKEDGTYQIYNPYEESGAGYDRVIWNGIARIGEMTYSSVSEDYGNGGNYISSLKPGESVSVNMAWIVNEDDLDQMYLNFSGDAVYTFSDSVIETGVVDIRQ